MTSETTSKPTSAIDHERSKTAFLFKEALYPGVELEIDLKRIMVSTHSKFQKIDVIETSFGKTLVTDGKTQSAELDEFMYHESLVHPPLIKAGLGSCGDGTNTDGSISRKVKRVFIGGGGELATAREVLRHKSVEQVVMVDLDETVLNVCKEYLPEWGGHKVASNPRLELIIGDAHEYLMNCTDTFDVIIMDISDPIEAGPGIMLYTQEFYEHAKTLLNDSGVFVTQAGTADSVTFDDIVPGSAEDGTCFAPITNTLNEVFDCVLPYSTNIPSFGSDWGFSMAFSSSNPEKSMDDFIHIKDKVIDDIVSSDITEIDDISSDANGSAKKGCDVLKYYDGESHRGMFSLPKPTRTKFNADKRIMTRENPVFMF
jgi:spermidine synthase